MVALNEIMPKDKAGPLAGPRGPRLPRGSLDQRRCASCAGGWGLGLPDLPRGAGRPEQPADRREDLDRHAAVRRPLRGRPQRLAKMIIAVELRQRPGTYRAPGRRRRGLDVPDECVGEEDALIQYAAAAKLRLGGAARRLRLRPRRRKEGPANLRDLDRAARPHRAPSRLPAMSTTACRAQRRSRTAWERLDPYLGRVTTPSVLQDVRGLVIRWRCQNDPILPLDENIEAGEPGGRWSWFTASWHFRAGRTDGRRHGAG